MNHPLIYCHFFPLPIISLARLCGSVNVLFSFLYLFDRDSVVLSVHCNGVEAIFFSGNVALYQIRDFVQVELVLL